MNIELSSNAMMGSHGAFTLEFLLILLIIPKSMLSNHYGKHELIFYLRVLFASIRNKGNAPCPRCLVALDQVQNLGQTQDRRLRIELRRVADAAYQRKITDARKWIYGPKNKSVKSKYVEDILKLDSLVPTSVSSCDCI